MSKRVRTRRLSFMSTTVLPPRVAAAPAAADLDALWAAETRAPAPRRHTPVPDRGAPASTAPEPPAANDEELDWGVDADSPGIDALQLFLSQMRAIPLLTAGEEIALAKRIEAGDGRAKERMVQSNLRLVV